MTPTEQHRALIRIAAEAKAGLHLIAHQLERKLWCDTLTAIAKGQGEPREMAKVALRSLEIRFERVVG